MSDRPFTSVAALDVDFPFATAETQRPIPSCPRTSELDADADVVSDLSSAALHAATAAVTTEPWFSDEVECESLLASTSVVDFGDEASD